MVLLEIKMHPHACPLSPLAGAGVSDLAQQGNHAQLLQQRGVEGDLVQTIEDLARRAWRALTFDRIDRNEQRIGDAHSRTNGVMVGLPE